LSPPEERPKDPQLVRYEFGRMLQELGNVRGRATELVTLYVPPGRAIADVMNYLRNEYAQAGNIKSRTTRKNVLSSLETIMNRLKQYRVPPDHGVAFFVGAKPIGADKYEMVSYAIEPPEPLNTYMYRCDSEFVLGPLQDMVHEPDLWGLIVIDRAEVTLGWLRGKRIEAVRNKQSMVPSKHGRGGQSQHRFERLIEHAAHDFFVRVAELSTELYLPKKDQLKGILIGGPGATKEYFVKQNYLHYELQKKVVEPLFDVGYTDEYGLKELVEKATTALHGLELTEEKKIVQRLLREARRVEGGLAVYGEPEVLRALQLGAVEILLISEGLQRQRLRLKCSRCGEETSRIVDDAQVESAVNAPCPKCKAMGSLDLVSKEDHVGEIFREASEFGAEIRMISTESDEGAMLLKAFGGVAGILRYPLAAAPRAAPPSGNAASQGL
jgi:peptide chain release factor subunit 1